MHILCTICSDLINQAENIYVTKCGHIFHHHCLAQWIERSKSCPQCRNKVTDKCMFRLFPTVSNDMTGDDAATVQSRLDDAQLQLRQAKASCKDKDDKLGSLSTDLKRNEDLLRSYEKKLVSRDSAVSALKEQLDYVKIQNKEVHKLKEENEVLKKNLQTLNGLQKVLNATAVDVENMLQGYTDVKTIAIFATALKRALCESESKKNESRDKLHAAKQQLALEKKSVADLQAKITQFEDLLHNAERKYEALVNHKRKSTEQHERTMREEPSVKQPRRSHSFDLNVAILGDSNSSLTTLVNKIENADSPYLNLKQSNLALSALSRMPSIEKASENARPNLQKATDMPLSIFHKKYPIKLDPSKETYISPVRMDVSFDGLGGHSKLDIFPTPKSRPATAFKCVPKLTSKHKLKRPSAPTGSQDIGKYIERLNH